MEGAVVGKREWEDATESKQAFVHMGYAFEPRDDLLADVAAFIEVDAGIFQACFMGERCGGEFKTPCGNAVSNSQALDISWVRLGEINRCGGGIVTGDAQAIDGEAARWSGDAEDMVSG